jgi:hypothetical protein
LSALLDGPDIHHERPGRYLGGKLGWRNAIQAGSGGGEQEVDGAGLCRIDHESSSR